MAKQGERASSVTRRDFMVTTAATAAATGLSRQSTGGERRQPVDAVNDAPEITAGTIEEAQRLAALEFDEAERQAIADDIENQIRRFVRRREVVLPNDLAPASVFDPTLGRELDTMRGESKFVRSADVAGPLPSNDEDIAYAPVTSLSRWIERGELTSARLTEIYLDRLERLGPKLECVVTVTAELARAQAKRADEELAAGRSRGPLHGIPWGAKDLFDTKGIRTSWGANPYKDRVPDRDATVVRMLEEVGAVLVAKTTLGALAYGDIWFGGTTRNPFNLEQGSSGSSAGSAAGTAAGLFGFSLGTETLGSIVSPCMRCGTTGLRPTFGRVPRTGAMALCWSLDKIGPICRTVEDCALVLDAIRGRDAGDASSIEAPFRYDADADLQGLRVGYDPSWFEGRRVTDFDKQALDYARDLGAELIEIELPDWPYDALMSILMVEAAAAFEELTLTNRDDELVWQEPQAWPNSFRRTWFVPAIELTQAERLRRKVAEMMAERFAEVEVMLGPSYAGSMLLITNMTGHPSVTLRAGFREGNRPHGMTVWGRLFDEGTILRLAAALERKFGVWMTRPEGLG
ncbi:MAG: amidase [Phycisphaerales bacterium]